MSHRHRKVRKLKTEAPATENTDKVEKPVAAKPKTATKKKAATKKRATKKRATKKKPA